MRGICHLADMAELSSGYYSRKGNVYILERCINRGRYIQGFSKFLNCYVSVESSAVRPMLFAHEIKDFDVADYQKYQRYLIIVDVLDLIQREQYPQATQYLRNCYEILSAREGISFSPSVLPNISQKLLNAVDQKKLIISATDNSCHTMLDARQHVISPIDTYTCRFYSFDIHLYTAYLAILNSKVFSFCWNRLFSKKKFIKRFDVLSNMPLPYPEYGLDMMLLERLAECLSYLTRQDVPPISSRMGNERFAYYLKNILDMIVYELYFPNYVRKKGLEVSPYLHTAPFVSHMSDYASSIMATYLWYQSSSNMVRQKLMLLDTRSPELLYPIHTFKYNE